MKRFFLVLTLAASLGLTGCGLIPKRVEFFQEKVRPVPALRDGDKEVQRQAAKQAAERADETLKAALHEGSGPAVVEPAKETAQLTDVVSESLGPPLHRSTETSEQLVLRLEKTIAKLNQRIEDFKKDNDENAGKKIEGTGLISVPYFAWLGIVGAALFVIYFVLRTLVTVAAAGSPPVALGLQAVQLGGRGVAALAKEVIHGGEVFKEKLAESGLAEEVQEQVKKLFVSSHREAQSPSTQDAIKKLTS